MNCAGTKVITLLAVWAVVWASALAAEPIAIEPRLVHLRSDAAREWSSFPAAADGAHLELKFQATKNEGEHALRVRQQDVKQAWRVLLNGKPLGQLVRDEADMVIYLPIAAGLLAGENTLRIECMARGPQTSDDIRVGEIQLDPRPVAEVVSEATLEIDVRDADTSQQLPARITVVNADGALQSTSATSTDKLAVRPGVVYMADGKARIGVPPDETCS